MGVWWSTQPTAGRAVYAVAGLVVGAMMVEWLDREPELRPEQVQREPLQPSEPDANGARGAARPQTPDPHEQERPSWLTAPVPPRTGRALPQVPPEASEAWPWLARVRSRSVSIARSYDAPRHHIGKLRLGALVRVHRPGAQRPGCESGWLELEPRGVLCPGDALALDHTPPPVSAVLPAPHARKVVPHRYVKVVSAEAYRYDRPPDAEALLRVQGGDTETRREYGARSLDGAYFLAIEDELLRKGRRWLKTHEGNYVRAAVTEPVAASRLVGARLKDAGALPMAFVVEPRTPVRSAHDGRVVGHARRYARVTLAGEGEPNDQGHVRTEDDYLLPAQRLRIVRAAPRPRSIPPQARWLQVDHAAQTLLAFHGSDPVYATLVSSGKAGRRTPVGVHRVEYKHLTATMRGKDPTGPYEVQEVPWVLYYDGPYAVHGAYWHDDFGDTRSHGCTNLAPADARRLFRFMRPELPAGWHTASEAGSYVHMRRGR